MEYLEKLYPGQFYHIYNRGNQKEKIFLERENYLYFLKKYDEYISSIADTYTYCLLSNHFHFLIRIKELEEIENKQTFEVLKTLKVETAEVDTFDFSQPFSNFFNAYAKAFNKKYQRTGSLFQSRFGRKRVDSDSYLVHLVHYIHFNPERHKFTDDYRLYPFSSYQAILSLKPSHLKRETLLQWFGNREEFREFHQNYDIERYKKIEHLIEDDDD